MNSVWKECYTLADNEGWNPQWHEKFVSHPKNSLRFFENVTVRRSSMDKRRRVIQANIFDKDGAPVDECSYLRGADLKTFSYQDGEINNQDICINKIRVPVIYLGWLNRHYGHFLMESLCRLWVRRSISTNILDNCLYYFDVHTSIDDVLSKSWILEMLSAYGINLDNLLFGNQDYSFDLLIVPSQAMILHNGVCPENQSYIWGVIKREFTKTCGIQELVEKVYLSRSGLSRDKRRLSNESELEQALITQGFVIVQPEVLTLKRQIQIYANANIIVGPSGSALHNAAFMKPGSRVVSITTQDFSLLNELLCCYANDVSYTLFQCAGDSKNGWFVDINKILLYLNNLR